MLELQNVSKWFGGLPALNEVTFAVQRARITALIGPNGAGKSTLINCISGVDVAGDGAIVLEQQPIERLPAHDIAALGVSRTFQNLKVFSRLSVLDNVLTGLTVAAERSAPERDQRAYFVRSSICSSSRNVLSRTSSSPGSTIAPLSMTQRTVF